MHFVLHSTAIVHACCAYINAVMSNTATDILFRTYQGQIKGGG
jgi:hypothetical protein